MVTLSQFSKDRLSRALALPPARIHVVPCGVDPTQFYPAPLTQVDHTLQTYRLQPPYMLFLGSLQPRKNLPRLLEAWREVAPRHPAAQLVLAGGGGGAAFRAAGLQALPPRVRLTGYVPDAHLPALYTAAHALVQPSLYEGFGLTPLEAMACGCPVIAARAAALPEVLGDAALLIDPADSADLAAAMHRVLSDEPLRDHLRTAGTRQAAGFPWERAALGVSRVLEEARTPS